MGIFINRECGAGERAWTASNGLTRRNLVLINKTGIELQPGLPFKAALGFLEKGNHSFIFINAGQREDDRILGIFLCDGYGYRIATPTVAEDGELFTASSVGGPGNSESRFGVYRAGTILAVDSYKGRQGERFWKLDPDNGWVAMGADCALNDNEITTI